MNDPTDYHRVQHDDEISLVDLARTLLRRKAWIIGVFLLSTLAALAFALMQERQYRFTTSVQIGEFGLDEYVAEAKSTVNVLENRILPVIERDFVDARDLERIPFEVTITADEGNSFVNLQSKAPERLQPLVREFHSALFDSLKSDHDEKLTLLERESDLRLNNLKASLQMQRQQLKTFQQFLGNATAVAGDGGREGETSAVAESSPNGMEASLSSSNNALTILLSQMQLAEQVNKRQSRINELEGAIESEKLKRSRIKPTRATSVAIASISPVGTGKSLIVTLGAVLGMMLGLFSAFIVEFVARVRDPSAEV